MNYFCLFLAYNRILHFLRLLAFSQNRRFELLATIQPADEAITNGNGDKAKA